ARIGTVRLRHGGLIEGLGFAPDGKMIASIGGDHALRVWDAATGRELHSIEGDIGDFRGVDFSSDSKLLAAGGNSLRVWDVATWQEVPLFHGKQERATLHAFLGDGKTLATSSTDHESGVQTLFLWDVATANLTAKRTIRHLMAWSPDGKTAAYTD